MVLGYKKTYKMIKREAKFQILFRHWLRANPMPSSAFELKQTTKNSILFSCVQEHQLMGLIAATQTTGLSYKLPDDSRGIKPFDMVHLALAYAYIVIKYPNLFVMIPVEVFIKEKKNSVKKSLSVDKAIDIAWKVVLLKQENVRGMDAQ